MPHSTEFLLFTSTISLLPDRGFCKYDTHATGLGELYLQVESWLTFHRLGREELVVSTRSTLFARVWCISLAVGFILLLSNVAGAGAAWEAELDGGPAGGKALHRGSAFLSMEDLRDEGPFDDCPDCTARALLPFMQKIYPKPTVAVGAWIKPTWGQFDAQIDSFESMTGKHHGMYKLYMPWKDMGGSGNWIYFSSHNPSRMQWQADAIANNGSVPMVNWMPLHISSLSQITNGSHDWFIRTWAREVRDWNNPNSTRILINWGHEMNIPEYPWSTNDTALYRSAYRRIVNIFREEGADNVEFVWSPNYMSHQRPDYNEYYPGDAYVDWVTTGDRAIRGTPSAPGPPSI